MFVALRSTDRSRVTSIASLWDNRQSTLRELATSGQLICPGCEQRLWLRIGARRRRHFAHRHLADCPLAHQSAELLDVKAQLFKWLETKYPGRVNLDMAIGMPGWDKLIDLLVEVEPGRTFAYWAFDRQQRSREDILAYRGLPGVHVHCVHTQSTLVRHSRTEIALTASQRDFISSSDYDACIAFGGRGHLHFLDGEGSTLRIYRALRCVHAPNLYAWDALREDLLSAARISPKTGEIVFQDDVSARAQWKQRQKQEKSAPPAPPPNPPPDHQALLVAHAERETQPQPGEASTRIEEPPRPSSNLKGPFRCEDCGIETLDWSILTPSAGTCVCHNCLKKRHQQKTGGHPSE